MICRSNSAASAACPFSEFLSENKRNLLDTQLLSFAETFAKQSEDPVQDLRFAYEGPALSAEQRTGDTYLPCS